ncbi:MAG: polysaccharide deacetylase family protein [Gemmatimonadota bacterium]
MSALRQLLRRGLEATLPASRFLVRGPASGAAVALTFDDGPHPDITPRLLDALARHSMHATFFVVGREAERYPALVQRIVAEGHAIGHHSWSHSEPSATSTTTLMAEVTRCRALLRDLTGAPVDRFRPPKGQLTVAKLAALLRLGQRVILWSEDPKDYTLGDGTRLTHWAATNALPGGTIALLHDTHRWCLDAIAPLAQRAGDSGIQFVSIDRWLPVST